MKSFIVIGIIIIVLISLLFLGVKNTTDIKPPFELGTVHQLDNIQGNASSTVVLVEYSDFQCPACRSYYFLMKEIKVKFADRIAFVYRHFPLTSIHPNAELAARAAEAAGRQGKFWEMHDLLFEKQDEWSRVADIGPMFDSYAVLLNISVEQFKKDWLSDEIKNFVRAQKNHSIRLGLQGTPSFFINGEQIENPSSAEAFMALINNALAGQQ